jgi:hypothetical protein
MFRGGVGALLLVIALLYFSGASNWLWSRVQGLDTQCYSALMRVSPKMSNPICGSLAKGMAAISDVSTNIGEHITRWKNRLMGSSFTGLKGMTSSISDRIAALASSSEALTSMIHAGPASLQRSGGQSLQQAIDSFTIGQGYLGKGGQESQALEWFRQGAQQPQGYGVMSQLALGNLYIGGGQGLQPNPQMAQAYLQQAKNSIAQLSASNSPQAKQLLQTLPGSPQHVQAQIDQAIRQLSATR